MGKGSSTTTTDTSQKWGPDSFMKGNYRDLIRRTNAVADKPYQAYDGDRIAQFNQDQQNAFDKIRQAQGVYQPYYDQAAGYYDKAGAPIYQTYENYMNPWTQQVVDATGRQFAASNKEQLSQVTGNAALKGALGGDRVGVAQAETIRQQKLAQDPTIANLYSQGYDKAIQAAQADASRYGQLGRDMIGFGQTAQGSAYTDANALYGAGAQQQQLSQKQLDQLYADFAEKRAFPTQNLQWQAGIYGGLGPLMGGQSSGTSATTTPPPDPMSTALGIGTTLAGAYLTGGTSLLAGAAGAAASPSTGFTGTSNNPTGGAPMTQWMGGQAFPMFGKAYGGAIERAEGGGVMLPYGMDDGMDGVPIGPIHRSEMMKPPPMQMASAPPAAPDPATSMVNTALSLAKSIKTGADKRERAALGDAAGADPAVGAASGPTGDPSQPRGIRNNNPGNIEDGAFARSLPGYAGSDGRFAKFETMDHGMGAGERLLAGYAKRGIDTPAGIIGRWAPKSDGNNVEAYSKYVAGGGDPNAKVDLSDPAVRKAIAERMFTYENGRPVPRAMGGGISIPHMADGGDPTLMVPAYEDTDVLPEEMNPRMAPPLFVPDYENTEVQDEDLSSPGLGAMASADGGPGSVPLPRPRPRPAAASAPPPPRVIAAPREAGVSVPASTGSGTGGFLSGLPKELGPALMAAGFGMMASKSPHLGNAIGEGGLTGMKSFSEFKEQGRKSESDKASAAQAAATLAENARYHLQTANETNRHNLATESNGSFEMSPGLGHDAEGNLVKGLWTLDKKKGTKSFEAEGDVMRKGDPDADKKIAAQNSRTDSTNQTRRDIATEGNTTRTGIATDNNQTRRDIAGENNETRRDVATEGNTTRRDIAGDNNQTRRDISGENNQTRRDTTTETNQTRKDIADGNVTSREKIAGENNQTRRDVATTRGANGANGGVWKVKHDAWLAAHPDDTAGALEYAGGKRAMDPVTVRKSALALAEKAAAADFMQNGPARDKFVREKAADYADQMLKGFGDGTQPAPTPAPTAKPTASATPPATTPALKPIPADAMAKVKAAIAAGKNLGLIKKQLIEKGYDTSGIE